MKTTSPLSIPPPPLSRVPPRSYLVAPVPVWADPGGFLLGVLHRDGGHVHWEPDCLPGCRERPAPLQQPEGDGAAEQDTVGADVRRRHGATVQGE